MSSTGTETAALPGWLETLARWGAALKGRLAVVLVVGAAALYLVTVNRYTGSYDEGVYWQSLRAMAQGHALYTSVFSSQAPYFLVSLYPFYLLFGQTIAAARIGVAVFGLLGVVAMYWLGSELGSLWTGLLASALLAESPFYLQQARALEADGPAVAVSILALALAVAAIRHEGRARRALAALSGVALVYGMLIKVYDVVAVLPIALYLLQPVFRQFDAGEGHVRWPTWGTARAALRESAPCLAWAGGGAMAAAVVLLTPFAGALPALWSQSVAFHLSAQGGLPAGLSDSAGQAASSFALVALLTAVTVGVAIWRRAWRIAPPLFWLLASIALILRLNPFFAHYAALVTPGFALLIALGPGLLSGPPQWPRARWGTTAFILAAFVMLTITLVSDGGQTGASLGQSVSANTQDQLAAVQTFTTPGEEIVTDDQYLAAATGHSVPPELVDTSYVRSHTGYLTATQVESVIERDHIRVVFLASGRLRAIPGFMTWLASEFRSAARAGAGGANGDGYEVYIRVPSGSTVA